MAKIDKNTAIALYKGGMTQADIARKYNASLQAVNQLIQRTLNSKESLTTYRENKDKIFEQIQSELLSRVNADNPKDAQQLVTSAAILEDKIRLERGQSTVNTTVDIRMLIASLPSSSPDQ